MGRTKYMFSDRAAAEAEYRGAKKCFDQSRRCLNAMLNKSVHWIRGGQYDAGIVDKDQPDGGVVMIVYNAVGEVGDNKFRSATTYTPDELREWYKDLAGREPPRNSARRWGEWDQLIRLMRSTFDYLNNTGKDGS
jgi:hypothetical protein